MLTNFSLKSLYYQWLKTLILSSHETYTLRHVSLFALKYQINTETRATNHPYTLYTYPHYFLSMNSSISSYFRLDRFIALNRIGAL